MTTNNESKLTEFDYLLNAFEQASQAEKPAELNYGSKRKALFAYVRDLEVRAAQQPRAAYDVGLPPLYMLAKLQMVMPLFQEARDALTAITEAQRKLHGISPTLADRMDTAGTYSLDQWLAAAPKQGAA